MRNDTLLNGATESTASRPAKPMLHGLAFTRQPICDVSVSNWQEPAIVGGLPELSGRTMWAP